jgi:hypothetical protein
MPTLRFILLAVIVLASFSPEAPAQTSGKIYRIGFRTGTNCSAGRGFREN